MLDKNFKVLLYSIKFNKPIECKLLDNEITRDLCRIYRNDFKQQSNDLLHFLSFVRDRYGEPYSSTLEEQINEFNSLGVIRPEDFDGEVKYLLSIYKEKQLIKLFSKYTPHDVVSEGSEKILDDIRKVLFDLENIDAALSPQIISIGDEIDEVLSKVEDKIENPGINGLSTGFSSLDYLIDGLHPGDLVYIGGRPSHGKTTLALNMTLNLAENGVPVLFFSKEMSYSKLVRRILSTMSNVSFRKIKTGDGLTSEDLEKIKRAARLLKSMPIYIDENFSRNLYGIIDISRKMIEERGVKVIFIDYIQLLAERSADSTHELGRISRQLKLLANEYNVSVVSISQLNRGLESREDKRPKLADLRQAGALEEDGDIVMLCYRDELYNPNTKHPEELEVIVAKNRDGEIGSIFLGFDAATLKVYELEE